MLQALKLLQTAKKNTVQIISKNRTQPRHIVRKIFRDDKLRDKDDDDETDEIADLEKRIT